MKKIIVLLVMVMASWCWGADRLSTYKYRRSHVINLASGAGTGYQLDLKVYKDSTEPTSFAFIERTSGNVHAAQGVAFDGVHYYTTAGTAGDMHHMLYKYDKDWNLIASRDVSGDNPTAKTQINHITIKDGLLYIGANDYVYPAANYGWIVVYACRDLSFISYHSVKDYTCEGCAFYDGHWWVCYDNYQYLSKYDSNWNFVADYALSYTTTGTHVYNGVVVVGDYFYLNIHEGATPVKCDVYKWNGTSFDEVVRLDPPTASCTQGICKDPYDDKMYWAERTYAADDHRVVTSSIEYGLDKVMLNGGCKDDFSDIRFTSSDGSTELDYWIEYLVSGEYARATVQVDADLSSANQTIYIYYGKPTAVSASSIANTMDKVNDFNGGTIDDFTNLYVGGTASADSSVKYEGDYSFKMYGKGGRYTNDKTFWDTEQKRIDFWFRGDYVSATGAAIWMQWNTTGDTVYRTAIQANELGIEVYDYTIGWVRMISGDYRNTWIKIKALMNKTSNIADFYAYDTSFNLLGSNLNTNLQSASKTYRDIMNYVGTSGYNQYLDQVLSRKYIPTEPQHGVWGVEERLLGNAFTLSGLKLGGKNYFNLGGLQR